MSIILFIIALGFIIFVHELGHFLFARYFGLNVSTFSIGFGPKLLSFHDRYHTRWQIALIPLGGFVAIERDGENLLMTCKPIQKMLVAFAGPMMNFIFSIICMTSLYATVGIGIATPQLTIEEVAKDTPAFYSGLKAQDRIIKIDNRTIEKFDEMKQEIEAHTGKDMSVIILRDNAELPLQIKLYTADNKPLNKIGIISKFDVHYEKKGVVESAILATKTVAQWVGELVKMLKNIFTTEGQKNLGGVISITQIAKQSYDYGFYAFVAFMAVLSVNLGFLNLLPIPVLDGGHIVIGFLELLIGRKLNKKVMDVVFAIGFILLFAFIIRATLNDILRLNIF